MFFFFFALDDRQTIATNFRLQKISYDLDAQL